MQPEYSTYSTTTDRLSTEGPDWVEVRMNNFTAAAHIARAEAERFVTLSQILHEDFAKLELRLTNSQGLSETVILSRVSDTVLTIKQFGQAMHALSHTANNFKRGIGNNTPHGPARKGKGGKQRKW